MELYAKEPPRSTRPATRRLSRPSRSRRAQSLKEDSSLYWKAFSEYKVQAMQDALESLKEMQARHPDSRWLEQALALEYEVKASMGKPVLPAATPDEELKLLASTA